MAESTLSLTLDDLRQEVGRFLFSQPTYSGLSAAEMAAVDIAIQRGLRQFYAPPLLPQERKSHVWSFLYPEASIVVWKDADYDAKTTQTVDSGTYDSTTDETPVTRAAGETWVFRDAMRGLSLKFNTSGNSFTIVEVVSTTQVRVAGNASGEANGQQFDITHSGDFGLPEDFGGITSLLTFDTRTGFPPVEITSDSRIRHLRMDNRNVQSFRPRLGAIRPQDTGRTAAASSTGSLRGQRFELVLWPVPDSTYTLHYRYIRQIDDLVADRREHPLGGMLHGETVMASCLAVAESMLHPIPPKFLWQERFMQRLMASVMLDREAGTAETLGQGVDPLNPDKLSRIDRLQNVTFNDVTY